MNTLLLAARNLVRNARRSIATLLGIAIGMVAILLFGGYKTNIGYTMQTAYVRLGGHLQIQHRDYFLFGSGNPAAYGIADYRPLIDAIRNDPVLQPLTLVVTPTLQFGGIAGNYAAGVSHTVIGNGIVADDHARMRAWNPYRLGLDTPPFLLQGAPANSVVVGLGVARILRLCEALKIADCPSPEPESAPDGGAALPADIAALAVRDRASQPPKAEDKAAPAAGIELLASTPRGTPNVAALNVLQAESQGFKEYDEVHVVLHLDQAQRLVYGRAPPRATSIIVQLRETAMAPVAAERLAAVLKDAGGSQPLVVRDFRFLNPFYVQSIDMFNTIFGFMFVLIAGIVMFTVSNTMNTAVVERTVEIGTLRAIGLRRAGVQRMFVTEGLLLGCAGTAIGVVLALLIAGFVNLLDLHWLPPGSSSVVPLAISVWDEPALILGASAGIIVIAALSAWQPARRASRLNVVDALRHA